MAANSITAALRPERKAKKKNKITLKYIIRLVRMHTEIGGRRGEEAQ
jgi:hypothetical protein